MSLLKSLRCFYSSRLAPVQNVIRFDLIQFNFLKLSKTVLLAPPDTPIRLSWAPLKRRKKARILSFLPSRFGKTVPLRVLIWMQKLSRTTQNSLGLITTRQIQKKERGVQLTSKYRQPIQCSPPQPCPHQSFRSTQLNTAISPMHQCKWDKWRDACSLTPDAVKQSACSPLKP